MNEVLRTLWLLMFSHDVHSDDKTRPRGFFGIDRGDLATLEGCKIVFDVINRRYRDIARLVGCGGDSEVEDALHSIKADDCFVSFSPIEVPKFGRSLMAPVFVGLVSRITGCRIKPVTAITGELGMW